MSDDPIYGGVYNGGRRWEHTTTEQCDGGGGELTAEQEKDVLLAFIDALLVNDMLTTESHRALEIRLLNDVDTGAMDE